MPPQNFEFDYDKFLRESRQAYDESVWQALRERYGENVGEGLFSHWQYSNEPPHFQYKTSYDTEARLPFDYEGEVLDINETEWQPQFRWFNNRPHDKFAYQYKPFDEWFTLFEITGEVLFKARQGKISLRDIGFQMRELVEKRYYKVERLY